MDTSVQSRFLPPNFSAKAPLALIAGKGDYPIIAAQRARRMGIALRLIAFEGETSEQLWNAFPDGERERIYVGQLGRLLKTLQRFNASHAIMAGQITPKRLFNGLHPDLKAIAILASLKERNAETIFGAIAREMEKVGVQLLDARAFMDGDLADMGLMNKGRYIPKPDHLEHGIRIAKEVASMDIGQGVVVNRGTVLAVEAFEGTDKMLERAGTFEADCPLFIKTVKPRQDYRFDVPIFGMRTIFKMADAHIAAAALEAGNVIILDKEAVLQKARDCKITLLGY